MYNHGITAAKTIVLPDLATRINEDCRKVSPHSKCYYTSFSGVGRGKDSKCLNKNVKSVIVFYMTLTTNYLDWKQVQKNLKTIENSSGKFSKITYNIHYLFAHKHS